MADTVSIIPDGVLAYGLQLPVQALSVRTSAPWERDDATIDDMVGVAQACDDASFLYVAVCHHVAIPRESAEMMSTQWFDPLPTLAYLAAHTTRTRLMTNVYVVGYQHPLQTAKAFATLDALSGGRVILGVGVGHVEGEFDALDVPFRERGRITDEAIDAITRALTDEWPQHAGARWKFSDVGQRPRPVQQPRPPIWIGGSGKPALRRVATRGDGWIPQGTPRAQLPDDIAYITRHREAVRPNANLEIGYITEYVYVGEPVWDMPRYSVSGSSQRLVDSFNELGVIGVSHLQLRFASRSAAELCDQIAAFGAEVGPHLERRPAP
ncbi:MAG: TIGR03619 family F420-dependent LLM class oxidoreductase [Actinomycetota bacterium]